MNFSRLWTVGSRAAVHPTQSMGLGHLKSHPERLLPL